MLRKIKAASEKVKITLPLLKITTTKTRLVIGVIGLAIILKFLFAASCSINGEKFKGSIEPLSVDSDLIKLNTKNKAVDNEHK